MVLDPFTNETWTTKFVPLLPHWISFFCNHKWQDFPNSSKGCGGSRKFYWGGIFFTGGKEPEEEWFWRFETFSKLKAAFCEYWTSIKIKINMTKEYEIKTKIEQEHWLQLKMLFLLAYNWKLLFSGGQSWLLVDGGEGNKNLVVGGYFSSWRGNEQFFGRWKGTLPHPPQKGKPLVVLCGVMFRLCWNVF